MGQLSIPLENCCGESTIQPHMWIRASRTVTAGQTASFSVTATGTGALSYQCRGPGADQRATLAS